MKFEDYVLLFLKDNPCRVPSVKFWGITLLIVSAGIKIQMDNCHILTVQDCYNEMDDLFSGRIYEGGWTRAWWEQYQYLRGLIKKPRWIN